MKRIHLTLGLLLAITAATPLRAQISAFTYQGRLNLNGAPANGSYDFMFRLLNDPTNGVAVPVIQINPAVPVTNGLFTTGMDFGAENFSGANRWLEINVRTNGSGPFTTLSPRQVLTPTPYAVSALTASNLAGALPASQISGTILNASLPASPNFSGTVIANNFSGDGANLTNVNAATLGGLNSSNFWRTTGNAGTTAGTHFLGTTDNQPLELKVNGARALRVEPNTNGAPNMICGSSNNFVSPGVVGATISGGGGQDSGDSYTNGVSGNFGTISGGLQNRIQVGALASTVGGGNGNSIQVGGNFATIGGGWYNIASGPGATVGGGFHNVASGESATVAGGGTRWDPTRGNTAAGYGSSIGGGNGNRVWTNAYNSTINGGAYNEIAAGYASINGGLANSIGAGSDWAIIGGGSWNAITFDVNHGTISGGYLNAIWPGAHYATISGGSYNASHTNTFGATIGGGGNNTIQMDSQYSTISGGFTNTVGSKVWYASIGGGSYNRIEDWAWDATIAGGVSQTIQSNAGAATIGGGFINLIGSDASFATICGGSSNTVSANGLYAIIPGGYFNAATNLAFAAGDRAKAIHTGAFVWGDSTDADIASTNANSVTMRASGGYRFFTDTNATTGASLAAGSGSWTSMSDRNAKENFHAANAREVLEKVVAVPVQTWNYKSQDARIRHIGPMAQDFKTAFEVGESETGISTVDADGVALAAIQGLNQKLEETRAENAELKQRLAKLERIVERLGPKQSSR